MSGKGMVASVGRASHPPRLLSSAPRRVSSWPCNVRERRKQAAEEQQCRLLRHPHQPAHQPLLRQPHQHLLAALGDCLSLYRQGGPPLSQGVALEKQVHLHQPGRVHQRQLHPALRLLRVVNLHPLRVGLRQRLSRPCRPGGLNPPLVQVELRLARPCLRAPAWEQHLLLRLKAEGHQALSVHPLSRRSKPNPHFLCRPVVLAAYLGRLKARPALDRLICRGPAVLAPPAHFPLSLQHQLPAV